MKWKNNLEVFEFIQTERLNQGSATDRATRPGNFRPGFSKPGFFAGRAEKPVPEKLDNAEI